MRVIETGGASVDHHMLNEESRKYFNRAHAASGTVFNYFGAPPKGNHLERMLECSQTNDQMSLIQYLKTAPAEDLVKCHFAMNWGKTIKPEWGPSIEKEDARMPFITQSLDEIYNSGKAPVIDAFFSFTDQVCNSSDPQKSS